MGVALPDRENQRPNNDRGTDDHKGPPLPRFRVRASHACILMSADESRDDHHSMKSHAGQTKRMEKMETARMTPEITLLSMSEPLVLLPALRSTALFAETVDGLDCIGPGT